MKIKANICISRDSSDTMRLKVRDEASRVTFLELEMSPHDLMLALTGLAYVDAKAALVRGLDAVGKKKITENRSVEYPGNGFDPREEMADWLAKNCQEAGWIISTYLGSQSSISRNGGATILHYSVYRFEEDAAQAAGAATSLPKGGEDA